jgi:hypothetical protein
VGPGGHLGHHAAEAGVLVDGGGDLVGEQLHPPTVVERDDTDTRLVARRLDADHDAHRGSLLMVCASAPLGQ